MQHRLLRRASGALFAAAALTACGDDDTTQATTPETATTDPSEDRNAYRPSGPDDDNHTTTSTTDTTSTTPETSSEAPDGALIEITVTDGNVEGGGRHEVSVGDTVTIRVTSDVADHVHVHGYDLMADVGPGSQAEITFSADIPGVWEVELEEARLALLELQVS